MPSILPKGGGPPLPPSSYAPDYVAESHLEITVEITVKNGSIVLIFEQERLLHPLKKYPSPTNANKGQLLEKAMALKIVNVKTSIHVTIILQKGT